MVNEAVDEPLSLPLVATPGRDLAARALLAGAGTQQRVSDLLGVSRRTIGRMAEADFSTALRDPQVLEDARTCLEDTARRGSTAEERAAAVAWLQEAARDEHQVALKPAATTPPRASPVANPTPRVLPRRPRRPVAPRNGAATSTTDTPGPPAPLLQVDALRRQQQRILHRSALIDYVLAAEKRSGDTADDGGRAGRTARRHHRGGADDRDPPASKCSVTKLAADDRNDNSLTVKEAWRLPQLYLKPLSKLRRADSSGDDWW